MAALRRWTLVLNVVVFLAGFTLLATVSSLDAKAASLPALLLVASLLTAIGLILGVSIAGTAPEIAARLAALILNGILLLVATRLGAASAHDPVLWIISVDQLTGGKATLAGIFLFAASVTSLLALLAGGES